MTDADLLALCVLEEAGGEIDDGKAAVARVIKNRMARKYESDGTITGSVLKFDQFSWAWFSFVKGKYARVADDLGEAEKIAAQKLAEANLFALRRCGKIAQSVFDGNYRGPDYDKLTDEAVLYLNPHIVSRLPEWADPGKLICTIGQHSFYRA